MRNLLFSSLLILAACPDGDDDVIPIPGKDAAVADSGVDPVDSGVADSGVSFDSGVVEADAGQFDSGVGGPCAPMNGPWTAIYYEVSGTCGARPDEIIEFDDNQPVLRGCEITAYGETADRCEIFVDSKCGGEAYSDRIFRVNAKRSKGTTGVSSFGCTSHYTVSWRIFEG